MNAPKLYLLKRATDKSSVVHELTERNTTSAPIATCRQRLKTFLFQQLIPVNHHPTLLTDIMDFAMAIAILATLKNV